MARRPRLVMFQACMLVPVGRNGRAFVKINQSSEKGRRRRAILMIERERISLQILEGLAVPRLVPLTARQLKRWTGLVPSNFVALNEIPGRHMDRARLSPQEIVGVWMFVGEQMAAMRRQAVLYTDIKAANILVRARPLRVVIVDFNYATAVRAGRTYPSGWFGYTIGNQAPEQFLHRPVTEQALVYQLGMLLARCWMGVKNPTLRRRRRGLGRMRAQLRRMGAPGLARLLGDCVAQRASDRPRDYGEVLARFKSAVGRGRPKTAVAVWRKLRAPYAARLARIGPEFTM